MIHVHLPAIWADEGDPIKRLDELHLPFGTTVSLHDKIISGGGMNIELPRTAALRPCKRSASALTRRWAEWRPTTAVEAQTALALAAAAKLLRCPRGSGRQAGRVPLPKQEATIDAPCHELGGVQRDATGSARRADKGRANWRPRRFLRSARAARKLRRGARQGQVLSCGLLAFEGRWRDGEGGPRKWESVVRRHHQR